jgi:uroporphyrinogen decarboxylase
MTGRERVLNALNHEKPDRVPLILGADLTTGIQTVVYGRLKERLGVQAEDRYLYDWQELGAIDPHEEVLRRLGSDARGVLDRFPRQTYEHSAARSPHSPYIDDWGVGSPEVSPGSYYPGIHPLAQAKDVEAILDYQHWPDMDDPDRLRGVAERVSRLAEENQYAIVGSPWLMFPMERATQLQGMEAFFINLAENPEFAVALVEHITTLCMRHMAHFLEAAGPHLDIIVTGDDLGTQESLLISPRMYRKLVKPIHADYLAFIKKHTNAKVYFHTDGDVFPLLDDLVEIGVDILNPIQTSAGRMGDIAELKRRYGKHLSFCGGVDTQRLLPYGTPEEIRGEVKRLIEVLGVGGGYLLASVHHYKRCPRRKRPRHDGGCPGVGEVLGVKF